MASDGSDTGSNLFDRYDTTAVLVPGGALLIGLWLLYGSTLPAPADELKLKDFSLGAFGVFAIAAYCVGHLIQAPAEMVTQWLWSLTGSPGEHIRAKLDAEQRKNIDAKLLALLNVDGANVTTHQGWQSVTLQMAALIASSGKSSRLLTFNANFGLFRGLMIVLAVLAVAAFVFGNSAFGFVCVGLAVLALIGMVSFARSYARELWNQFLSMTPSPPSPGTASAAAAPIT